jgi:cyclin G-associated kinase
MRQDLDMSYLTSRIIAMSYPAEGLESAYRNHIESVKAYLETRKSPYVVVNVSGRPYGSSKFGHHVKLINGEFAWKEAFRLPSLIEILCICDQLSNWVTEQEKRRLLVFHCTVNIFIN